MAGDWIKMTTGLRTDPTVGKIARLSKLDRLAVIGRLWALWSWADAHAVGGHVRDAVADDIDELCDCEGFADVLCEVGWLECVDAGVIIPNHEKHNGESAKERAQKNARQAKWRQQKSTAPSTKDTAKRSTAASTRPSTSASTSPSTDASTREEKRREETTPLNNHSLSSSDAGRVCKAMKAEGIADVSTGHPDLLALIGAGASDDEFRHAARSAADRGKGFAYAIGTLKRQRIEAAAAQHPRGALQSPPKPLTAGEARMLEACPSLVSESVRQRAAATARPTQTSEVIDAEAPTAPRRLG